MRILNQKQLESWDPMIGLFPLPVVLVSCADSERKPNIITISWIGGVCSTPPQLGIAIRPSRLSYALIKESKAFVVNIPTEDQVEIADFCGLVSGRNHDKFEETKLTPEWTDGFDAPYIKECPVSLFCNLKQTIKLGSHELFIGEVISMRVEDHVTNGQGNIDFDKMKTFVFNLNEYWSLGKKIASYKGF